MKSRIESVRAIAELGHGARTERVQSIGRRWAAKPQASFPEMVESDAELLGLNGLLESEAVHCQEALAAHPRAAVERIDEARSQTVLVVHGTTELSFGGESVREGLGRVARTTQGKRSR